MSAARRSSPSTSRRPAAEVTFSTVLGDDSYRDFVLDDLKSAGVEVHAVIDQYAADDQQERDRRRRLPAAEGRHARQPLDLRPDPRRDRPARYDECRPTRSCSAISATASSTAAPFPSLIAGAARRACFRVADSQVASRWGNITDFQGFDLITPNEREARFALGDQDSGIRPLASNSTTRRSCKLLILKLGERGVLACRSSDHESLDSFFVIDSFVDRLVDAVGAGDALLAYATLAMLVGPRSPASRPSSARWRRPSSASATATSRSRPTICARRSTPSSGRWTPA